MANGQRFQFVTRIIKHGARGEMAVFKQQGQLYDLCQGATENLVLYEL